MDKKSITLAGLLIGLGLLSLGIFVNVAAKNFKNLDRSVQVKGLSEIEVPANRVIWPIAYTELGNDLKVAYSSIETKNEVIIKFLIDNGLQRQDISVAAPKVVDKQADRYNNVQTPYRYYVTSVVTVSSENVDKVRELMTKQAELLRDNIAITGEDWQYQTLFLFTRLNEVKPQMVEDATKNARASAEKFAEDSGSRLGKIKSASQGQLTISDRDSNTPYIKTLRIVTTIDYTLED